MFRAGYPSLRPVGTMWQIVDRLMPPLVSPLRAVYYMLILVYVPHLLRALFTVKGRGFYNNKAPREQWEKGYIQGELGDMARRASSCHLNNWEAFAYFTASALTAHILGLDRQLAARLSTLFLVLRAAYIPLYVFGFNSAMSHLRSIVFILGLFVSGRLTVLSLQKAGL